MPTADGDLALGVAVRALREERGLSQEDVAHAAGVTTGTYASVERGQANPTWATLRKISAALDVRLSELAARAGQ
jgi:transcriptional regulator with XRE-family HTH domain